MGKGKRLKRLKDFKNIEDLERFNGEVEISGAEIIEVMSSDGTIRKATAEDKKYNYIVIPMGKSPYVS